MLCRLSLVSRRGYHDPMAQNIITIISFIRGTEPRPPIDLVEPVRRQMELAKQHKFPVTWLVQYDAIIDPRFVELLKAADPRDEIGGWFEMNRPHVEAAGLRWRGRSDWDSHADVAFSIGYTPAERVKLVDAFMAKFKEVFGRHPASVGAWIIDAHTLSYLAERYGIVASCNAADQGDTDGRTLAGGYCGPAYYPSRRNAFMPAQGKSRQIPVPVFRMSGTETDLDDIIAGPSLSFGYAQVSGEGQINRLAELSAAGKVQVQTLGATGRWFTKQFGRTPPSAVVAMEDSKGESRRAAWYSSRFYRAGFLWEGDRLVVCDVHKFDQSYPERYLKDRCRTHDCIYDTLPVYDGAWGKGIELITLAPGVRPLPVSAPTIRDENGQILQIEMALPGGQKLAITCAGSRLMFRSDAPNWALRMPIGKKSAVEKVAPGKLYFRHEGFAYEVPAMSGDFRSAAGGAEVLLIPARGRVTLSFGGD